MNLPQHFLALQPIPSILLELHSEPADSIFMLSIMASGITYGVPVLAVEEISKFTNASPVPGGRAGLLGTISFRGQLIPVVDLRALFGKPSLVQERQELVAMLDQREKDHIEWIDELIASVKEDREFRKATDPKKCAFGKWFYSFQSYDSLIQRELKAFEEPHNRIHALANSMRALARTEGVSAALDGIQKAKDNELRSLLSLFSLFKGSLLGDLRQIVVVIRTGKSRVGILADAVNTIKRMDLSNMATHFSEQTPLLKGTFEIDGTPTYIIDVESFGELFKTNADTTANLPCR